MPISANVTKRAGTKNYQARIRVPADLVNLYKKKELTKSLGTPDPKAAKKLGRVVIAGWEAEFEDLRGRRAITDADKRAAAAEHYRRQLELDDHERLSWNSPEALEHARQETITEIQSGRHDLSDPTHRAILSLNYEIVKNAGKISRENRQFRMEELLGHSRRNEFALIAYAADEFIRRHRLTLEKDSQEYRDLCRMIMRGEIEFLRRTFERDEGNYGGRPADPLLDPNLAPMNPTTFEAILKRQEELSKRGIGGRKAESTMRKYRTVLAEFGSWRGSTRAATVTAEEVERWRDELSRRHERKTVRDKCAAIRAVLHWGQAQSRSKLFPQGFPLEHLALPAVDKKNSAEITCTVSQAQKILGEARRNTRTSLRWAPWLMAYSGARVSEVLALEKRDIFEVGSRWFYTIRVEGEVRTTKSMQQRHIPIHQALLAEGFLDFVKSAPDGALFPDARSAQDLRDWIREEVIGQRKGRRPAPNHGFRHLFEDLRFGRLTQEAANYITGRANAGSDRLYGKSTSMLPALAEEMDKYPDVMKLT